MPSLSPIVRQSTGSDAFKALAHPVRLRLFYAVAAHGEATATMLAQETDLGVSSASYHLTQLAKYGLIEAVDAADRDRRERWWRIRKGGVTMPDDSRDPAAAVALKQTVLRHHVWQLSRYLDAWPSWAEGVGAFSSDMVIRLSDMDADRFQVELLGLLRRYAEAGSATKDRPMLVMVQAIPFQT